jgi:hypothetical protein
MSTINGNHYTFKKLALKIWIAHLPCQTYPEKRYALLHQYNTVKPAYCPSFVVTPINQSINQSHSHTHTHTMISVILKDRRDVKVETHTKFNFYGLAGKVDIFVY